MVNSNRAQRRHAAQHVSNDLSARIRHLRELLVGAKDLSKILNYFHDELAGDAAFVNASEPTKHERINQVLGAILRSITGVDGVVSPVALRSVEQGLVHGWAAWHAGLVVFVYFDDLDVGACCYMRSLVDPLVHHVRFSLVEAGAQVLPGFVHRGTA